MSKITLKIVLMLLLIFTCCTYFVHATDINLNLPGTTPENSENV